MDTIFLNKNLLPLLLSLIACTTTYAQHPMTSADWYKKGKEAEKHDDRLAVECYTKAIALKPGYYIAYYSRALCRSVIGTWEMKNQKHPDTANNNLRDAVADFNVYIKSGDKKFRESAYFIRGESNDLLGRYEDAFKDLTEAVKLKPNDSSAIFFLNQVKLDMQKH